MRFNTHFDLSGKHAFLSASKYAWIRYDDDKLRTTYANHQDHLIGSRLHAFASEAIGLGIKLPRSPKTLNMFVNDVIGFRMESEQVLYYSENCFGTADAISFKEGKTRGELPKLMIFDLKTGVTKASFDQLLIYVAYFCLEYGFKPEEIDVELRLYQNDEVLQLIPDLEDIVPIIEKTIRFDQIIKDMKSEAGL